MKESQYFHAWAILIGCALFICSISVGSCRKKQLEPTNSSATSFWAERLRPPADANGDTDILTRRKLAFEMLSNGIPDRRAIILNASVKEQPSEYEVLRFVRNDPILTILVVDESNQVGFIHYSASKDPNAFGKPLFGLYDYRLLFGERSSKDCPPVYYWEFFIKSYEDIRDFRLLKLQEFWYSWWAVLETPQAEVDTLKANAGQIMLFDRDYKLLDRFALRPPSEIDVVNLAE